MHRAKTILALLAVALGPWALIGRAQKAVPVGLVTVATHATLGNTEVSVGSTVFSGDLLKTGDDGRLNIQAGTVQFAVAANSSVRVFRNGSRVIVEIERGTLAYTAKGSNEDLVLFALDVRLVPKTNVPAAGEVSIAARCDVIVTAVRSTIDVTSGRETKTVEETKSYSVVSEFGVDYRDSWQPVLADYPDYSKDSQYHHSHSHVACPAVVWQNAKGPVSALGKGHFAIIVGGTVGIITGVALHEVFESPDRP